MRVLVVHNRYRSAAPSGENRVVEVETAALRRRGHVVSLHERHSDEIEHWTPLRRALLPGTVVWSGRARRELAAAVRRSRPDVVHVHNTFPLLSASVLAACRDARVPVVSTLHNYKLLCASGDFFRDGQVCHRCATGNPVPGLLHGCYRGSRAATVPVAAWQTVAARAWRSDVSAYIAISAGQASLLSGLRLDPDRVFVKHNLVPAPPDLAPVPGSDREHAVAYVGRLDAAKGVPVLMRAWDAYRATAGDHRLRLVVAGDGPLGGAVRSWAASRPSVRVVGMLTARGCAELVSRSRAVVLPSAWEETFGLVVVEAMAVGTPTVASAHGSLPELVTDGVDGVLVPPGDPEGLAAALRDVDERPDSYAALGDAAARTYRLEHDPERNVDRLVDIYRFAVTHPSWRGGHPSETSPRRPSWTDDTDVTPTRGRGTGNPARGSRSPSPPSR